MPFFIRLYVTTIIPRHGYLRQSDHGGQWLRRRSLANFLQLAKIGNSLPP
jgi:hypothetical protein